MNELLTVPEAAEFLRTTPKGVRKMIERGRMPGVVKVGRRVLIRREDLRKSVGLATVEASNDFAARQAG